MGQQLYFAVLWGLRAFGVREKLSRAAVSLLSQPRPKSRFNAGKMAARRFPGYDLLGCSELQAGTARARLTQCKTPSIAKGLLARPMSHNFLFHTDAISTV